MENPNIPPEEREIFVEAFKLYFSHRMMADTTENWLELCEKCFSDDVKDPLAQNLFRAVYETIETKHGLLKE